MWKKLPVNFVLIENEKNLIFLQYLLAKLQLIRDCRVLLRKLRSQLKIFGVV